MCETIEAIKEGKYKIKKQKKRILSDACLDFLEKCLEKDPKLRVSSEELSNHFWLDDGFLINKPNKSSEKEK